MSLRKGLSEIAPLILRTLFSEVYKISIRMRKKRLKALCESLVLQLKALSYGYELFIFSLVNIP